MKEGHIVTFEVTVKYPARALATVEARTNFMNVVAASVVNHLSVDPEEVDVDLLAYSSDNAKRGTLVSVAISGPEFNSGERMTNVEERLNRISDEVRRVIADTFHHIDQRRRLTFVRFTPLQEGYGV